MGHSTYVVASAISILFAIVKFIEIKFILKEEFVVKKIIKDSVMVYISVVIGLFIVDQVSDTMSSVPATAFTDSPSF